MPKKQRNKLGQFISSNLMAQNSNYRVDLSNQRFFTLTMAIFFAFVASPVVLHHPICEYHTAESAFEPVVVYDGVLSKKWKSIRSRVEPEPFVFPIASDMVWSPHSLFFEKRSGVNTGEERSHWL